MNSTDMVTVLGYLFAAWGIGWGSGFCFYTVKRGIEKIL